GLGNPTRGSVLERLMERAGIDQEYDFFEGQGITLEHFSEARAYLTQEVAALGRSLDTSIFANELIDPTYVAVSAEPRLPDPQFYAGLARHSGASLRWSMATSGAPVPSIASLATVSNLSDFSDHVLSLASQALSADFPGSEEDEA